MSGSSATARAGPRSGGPARLATAPSGSTIQRPAGAAGQSSGSASVICSRTLNSVARGRTPASDRPGDHRHASRTLPASDVTSISPSNPTPHDRRNRFQERTLRRSPGRGSSREASRGSHVVRGSNGGDRPLRRAGRRATTASRVTGHSASARHSGTAPTMCLAMASRTGSISLPTMNPAESRRAASSVPMEHVRRARRAGQPPCPVSATGSAVACCSASSVNSQCDGIGELRGRLAPQLRGLHQDRGPVTEMHASRSDIGDPRGVGQS